MVFQRSCECLGRVADFVLGVVSLAAVWVEAGEEGGAIKFAGPESVREAAWFGLRSLVKAATALPAEFAEDWPGGNGSAAEATATSAGTRRRVLRTWQTVSTGALFVFAEIGLRTIVGRFLRNCDVMRVTLSDTGCGNLNELRVRA